MKTLKSISVLFFLLCLLSSCTKKQEQSSFSSEASASPKIAIQEQQEEMVEKPAEKTLSAESVEHESVETVSSVEEISTIIQTEEPVENTEIEDILEEEIILPQTEITRGKETIAQAIMLEDCPEVFTMPDTNSTVLTYPDLKKGDIVYVYGTEIIVNEETGTEEIWYFCTINEYICHYSFGWDMGFWVPAEKIDMFIPYKMSTITLSKNLGVKESTGWRAYSSHLTLEISINRGADSFITKVNASQMENQNFYTFCWNDCSSGFHYSDPIGTFIYDPETDEIKHVSLIGPLESLLTFIATNDCKYILGIITMEPFGTFSVWDPQKGTSIISGNFFDSLFYDGNSIIIGYDFAMNEQLDTDYNKNKEYFEYADSFRKENPRTEEQLSWGNQCRIYVKYRLDLNSLEKTFIDCEYVRDTFQW